ncbi:MAG TPA: toxin TcdB middle/C-terminal domain-containing protein, partial [Flavobacteriales bacterium]|nr:toxin TcdB middle/C-terminal domain-containing protein [Flavobacteriales bacterium]
SPLQQRPYTVSETQTGLRLVASPNTNATIKELAVQTHSNHIFFSYGLASRSTTWERGNDPMTKFSFTGDIDPYGQPLSQISIAVPRGKDPRTGGELASHGGVYDPARGYDATIQYTHYIHKDETGQYMVDRVKQARSYEATNDGSMSVFTLRDDMLRPVVEWATSTPRLLALAYTYYDGDPYFGLAYGELGAYGLPVRNLVLRVQPAELDVFGALPPPFDVGDWSGHPAGYASELGGLFGGTTGGYQWRAGGSGDEDFAEGYYALDMTTYDHQVWSAPHRGLPVAKLDTFFNPTYIGYDPYQVFPTWVQDAMYMVTYAGYDYRVMQVGGILDANENATYFGFTPLGLMHKTAVGGKYLAPEGDSLEAPGVLLEYDLFAYMDRGEPVRVKTTQRQHHVNAPYSG